MKILSFEEAGQYLDLPKKLYAPVRFDDECPKVYIILWRDCWRNTVNMWSNIKLMEESFRQN